MCQSLKPSQTMQSQDRNAQEVPPTLLMSAHANNVPQYHTFIYSQHHIASQYVAAYNASTIKRHTLSTTYNT